MEAQVRRGTEVKDDDPIIPFGPQPTVSRFGAISRTSKTGYQTTGPVQAMASAQGPKHMAGRETNQFIYNFTLINLSSGLSSLEVATEDFSK